MLFHDHHVGLLERIGAAERIKNHVAVKCSADGARVLALGERRQERADLNEVRTAAVEQYGGMDLDCIARTECGYLAIDQDLQIVGGELIAAEDIIRDILLVVGEITK